MNKIYNIYMICNICNDRVYINMTPNTILTKMAGHKYFYRKHGITNKLSEAFSKLGENSFFIKTLLKTEEMTKLEASIILKQQIHKYDTISTGYNGFYDKSLKNKEQINSFGNLHNIVKFT
jgi:hypothetical protein